jgi:coenzyme F420 hydrogenase subunit beta
MQMAGLEKYTARLKFLIGLMCSESYTYEGLMEKHVRDTLGVNLRAIKKMNIKGEMLVATKSEVKAIPLAYLKQYVRRSCGFCGDFSAELADMSLGGLGMEGWTFVVARTEAGEKLLEEAEKAGGVETKPVEENHSALKLLARLSSKKRESTKK